MSDKIPEYMRLGIEPAEGGKSLLQNELGLPLIPKQPKKHELSKQEISNEPIMVKASQKNDDDKFIPPMSNFVPNVGADATWYDKVDVGSLQGIDPLAELKNPKLSSYKKGLDKQLEIVKATALASLSEVETLKELDELRTSLFGKNGMFQPLVSGLKVLTDKNEQVVMSNLISDVYEELKFEFEAKSYSLEAEVAEEAEEAEEEVPQIEQDDMVKKPVEASSFEEGCYAIILDNNPEPMVVKTQEEARILLSRLILGNNIEISRLKLIKRLPIDFGVLIRE